MTATRSSKIDQVKYLEVVQKEQCILAEKLKGSDNPEAIFYGLQLAECVSDENLFVGFGMKSQDGEIFTGRGNLVGTSSRMDRFYLQRQAKIARKTVQYYLLKIKLQSGEHWRFVTLTMPKLRGYSFWLTMKVFNDAFKKLSECAFWKKNVRAGTKSKEFTLGKEWEREKRPWTLKDDGFHIHGHLIVASKWLENRKSAEDTERQYDRQLAKEWKRALIKSAEKNGVVLEFNTSDGLPIVGVQLVKNKATNENEISLKDAIDEVAKYITKPSSLDDLPVDQIMEINAYLKGKRMIEPIGEANDRKGKVKSNTVALEVKDTTQNQDSNIFIEDSQRQDTYLVYTETIERCSRLKTQCLTLINQGEIDEARALIQRTFEKRRAFRRKHLTILYPDAEFMTLDGEVFSAEDYELSDFRERWIEKTSHG